MRILHLGGGSLGQRVRRALGDEDDVESVTDLRTLRDAVEVGPSDWFVSAGFRHIVPAELLATAGDTCNVHTSFLPWGRGAHPNVWVLADGEPAGVSIHRMTEGVDAGPIFAQRSVETTLADDARTLYQRLEDAAVLLFAETWPRIRSGEIRPVAQEGTGSYHRSTELAQLAAIDLDHSVTWRRAIDVLRALTFPPYRNIVIEQDGRRYSVEIQVTNITDVETEGSRRRE